MKKVLHLILLALLVATTLPASAAQQFRQDRIIVKFRDPAAAAQQSGKYGTRIRRFENLGGVEVIQLAPGITPAAALAGFRADPNVAFATGDRFYKRHAVPNDERVVAGEAWQFANTGAKFTVADADIDGVEAWDVRHDAPTTIVAVVDTGVRYTHEDLFANMWRNPGEIAGNGVDDDGNGIVDDVFGADFVHNTGNPMDDEGHGSHVAGILGAVGNNGKGSAGVAWKVQIMAVKVLPEFGPASTSDIIAGFEYARQKGAHIINASLGLTGAADLAMSAEIGALEAAGITLVVSAGNDDSDNDFDPNCTTYPASDSHANVVTVAASSRSDKLATFSNYGWKSVDIAAPGVEIVSSVAESDSAYDTYSGTSMSAPVVSGALALLREQFPADTMAQRLARLYGSVDLLPEMDGKCFAGGRLNLHRALAGGVPSRPANDDFFDAKFLIGVEFSGSTVTNGAGTEAGETALGTQTKTAWWLWRSDYNGDVSIETRALPGTTPNVTVFGDGFSVDELPVRSSGTNQLTFTAVAGRFYYVRIGTTGADAGPISFYGRYTTLPAGYGDVSFLSVGIQGAGTVSPLLGSSRHKQGKRITLTAKPAQGNVFLGWVDPADDTGAFLSHDARYSFLLPHTCGFSADAIFIPNPFRDIEGAYHGIASRVVAAPGVADAFLMVKVTRSGAFTGTLIFDGKKIPLHGKFTPDFKADVIVRLPGSTAPVTLSLKVGVEHRMAVTFTHLADYEGFAEPADRDFYSDAAPQTGRYTMRMSIPTSAVSAPFGYGYGFATVSQDGTVRFVGKLPDGTPATQGAALMRGGEWPFFAAPHKKGGSIAGRIAFDFTAATTDLSGDLRWVKAANIKEKTYTAGFDVSAEMHGARYYTLQPGAPILDGLVSPPDNLVLGGDSFALSAGFSISFSQAASGAFSGPAGFKMTFDPRSGYFAGQFKDPDDARVKLACSGVLILKTNTAAGQFTIGEQTGYVFIDQHP
jgi:subtilisin family serine protease